MTDFIEALPKEYSEKFKLDDKLIFLFESPNVTGNVVVKETSENEKMPSVRDKNFSDYIHNRLKKNENIIEASDNGIFNYFVKKINIKNTRNYKLYLCLDTGLNIYQLNAVYCEKISRNKKHGQKNTDHALKCVRELISIISCTNFLSFLAIPQFPGT